MGYRRLPPLTIPTDPFKLGYAAGIIDGEGHIGATKTPLSRAALAEGAKNPSITIRLAIVNSDYRLVEWLTATFGGGYHEMRGSRKGHETTWKRAYAWTLGGANCEAFLRAILPYLVLKREQAIVALMLRDLGKNQWMGRALDPELVARRQALKDRLHELNRRGAITAEDVARRDDELGDAALADPNWVYDGEAKQGESAVLTTKQKLAVDEMVRRRMANTGESEAEARGHVADYLRRRAADIDRAKSQT